ncbi:hypothetical protein DN402_03995 [Streptomyces sp. SW4]|nr:hypothetical protein DN402_03995 [Streptomyces sp. SW4]
MGSAAGRSGTYGMDGCAPFLGRGVGTPGAPTRNQPFHDALFHGPGRPLRIPVPPGRRAKPSHRCPLGRRRLAPSLDRVDAREAVTWSGERGAGACRCVDRVPR